MSGITYVDQVREDLDEVAWRVSMKETRVRGRRGLRRPSWRAAVAAATVLTFVAAGAVGWFVVGPGDGIEAAMKSGSQPGTTRRAVTPLDQGRLAAAPSPAPFGGFTEPGAVAQHNVNDVASGASIVPPGAGLSKVVKTADMTIVVDHGTFGPKFDQVSAIADRLGGYVQTSSTHGGKSGFVTIRVPSNRFRTALSGLHKLGRIDGETVSGKDVTSQYVDLKARIHIAKARRRVLFGLMNKATSIEQTIRVQNALDDVQLRIEELQGDLNVLNDEVSQGTIRVSMREVGVKVEAATRVTNPSVGNAFDRAIAGFFGVVSGVVIGLGYVIPALALLVVLWLVVTRVRKRFA